MRSFCMNMITLKKLKVITFKKMHSKLFINGTKSSHYSDSKFTNSDTKPAALCQKKVKPKLKAQHLTREPEAKAISS